MKSKGKYQRKTRKLFRFDLVNFPFVFDILRLPHYTVPAKGLGVDGNVPPCPLWSGGPHVWPLHGSC
jgi:hypothetical protein